MVETDHTGYGQTSGSGVARKRLLALVVIAAVAASAGVVQAFQMRPPTPMSLTSAPAVP